MALSFTWQSPVVIHDVLKVFFTSIIDDEGSWAGQALGNFSTTCWIWIPGQAANLEQQQVWPVDRCLCALALTHRSDGPPRCLHHQSLPLLSCCRFPRSFCDCTSSGRSQAHSQLPSSWDPRPLLPLIVGVGDHVLWHVPILVLNLTVSCSFTQ